MRHDDVLSVTMTREAAERLKSALIYAEGRIFPEDECEVVEASTCSGPTGQPPVSAKAKVAYDHAEWLRWAIGRIAVAEGKTAVCGCYGT